MNKFLLVLAVCITAVVGCNVQAGESYKWPSKVYTKDIYTEWVNPPGDSDYSLWVHVTYIMKFAEYKSANKITVTDAKGKSWDVEVRKGVVRTADEKILAQKMLAEVLKSLKTGDLVVIGLCTDRKEKDHLILLHPIPEWKGEVDEVSLD